MMISRMLTLVIATVLSHAALAAALPTAPQTFDSTYVAQTGGHVWNVNYGGDLQGALNQAQLGDTIVLATNAEFVGPFTLPNKTSGSGWIYVVSSNLFQLPPPGTRVSPAYSNAMPKILAPNGLQAITTQANAHHYRFVGIEFAESPSASMVFAIVAIGGYDTSPATLANHIVFDRCYVHGNGAEVRRGIEMDGAYIAVVDSYISDIHQVGFDTQALWAYNTTGPLQMRNNYLEAAGENVMIGGADSKAATLIPSDIEIRNNYFYKPLSWLALKPVPTIKNLLEFKAAQRVLVNGNLFENSPASSQVGFALLVTPRGGYTTWTVTNDIAITNNTFVNVGSGINILGHDTLGSNASAVRVLVQNNLLNITALNGADGRAFQFVAGGSDYTIDHNTILTWAGGGPPPWTATVMADCGTFPGCKVNNWVFTNNLVTPAAMDIFGSGMAEGLGTLNAYFTNWTVTGNVFIGKEASLYPPGNDFPNVGASLPSLPSP